MSKPLTVTRATHSCYLIQTRELALLTRPGASRAAFCHPRAPVASAVSGLRPAAALIIGRHHDHGGRLRPLPGQDHAAAGRRWARIAGFAGTGALEPGQAAAIGRPDDHTAAGKHSVCPITGITQSLRIEIAMDNG